MPTLPPRSKSLAAGILAVCITCVGAFEGLRTKAYLDPVGIATICYGATEGVHLGQTASVDECKARLGDTLQATAGEIRGCLKGDLSPGEWIAYTSAAYNIGTQAFCGSSMARLFNRGDHSGACNALLMWDKAGGHPLPGLTARRHEERAYCLGNYDDRIRKATDSGGSSGAWLRGRLDGERLARRRHDQGQRRGLRAASERAQRRRHGPCKRIRCQLAAGANKAYRG